MTGTEPEIPLTVQVTGSGSPPQSAWFCGDCGDAITCGYSGRHVHENDGSRLCEGRIAAIRRKPELLQRFYPEEERDRNPVPTGYIEALGLTRVIFRKWGERNGSDVIALFPDETWGFEGYLVASYEHVGQHGAADYASVMRRTRAATPEEYRPLRRELESGPYDYWLLPVRRRKGRKS